ncbi:MAG: PorT family protein [Hymenobacteraceae bacterium]|nr:PorT family protein [Hymenobacteraceae bacterium]MDX5395052.1 PorT family protein [Hymenobacteraceae bacterium]MDX5442388.1 PorT family protein [Hymenobacteraceae bacterium]MDX5511088.1 PorT family protein [Hymenobacteraceae bacterium]
MLLGLLFITETTQAQARRKYKPKKRATSSKTKQTDNTVIGFRVGGTAAGVNINENEFPVTGDYQFFPGLQGGLIINIAKNDTFSIQPEVLFTQKGYHIEGIYNDSSGSPLPDSYLKVRNQYIEVPVLAKLAVGNSAVQFVVNGGPYLGYWLNSKIEQRTAAGDSSYTLKFESRPVTEAPQVRVEPRRLELGGVVGTGIKTITPRGTFTFDLRYHFSITDSNKYSSDRPENLSKVRNKYFSASVGYILRN